MSKKHKHEQPDMEENKMEQPQAEQPEVEKEETQAQAENEQTEQAPQEDVAALKARIVEKEQKIYIGNIAALLYAIQREIRPDGDCRRENFHRNAFADRRL